MLDYKAPMQAACPNPAYVAPHHKAMNERSLTLQLEGGEPVQLRPIQPQDTARMRDGIAALSDHSRYLRFFNGARTMPDHVVERLCNVDGWKQIAWGALDLQTPGQPAIGAVRAVRKGATDVADLALAVLDSWHSKGIARLLMTAVVADARMAGISVLTADTLAENTATRQLFRGLGGLSVHRDGPVIGYRFDIATFAQKLELLTPGHAGDTVRSGLKRLSGAHAV